MLRVTEDEHGDAHGEHVEARISGASGSWCSWCRRGAHGGGLRGAGDAVVVMVNVAAGLRACRCPGRREMISPRGPLEVAGRHRRTTAGQAFQTTAATMPAPGTGRQGNWCCSLPGPAPGRNPNRLVHQVTDSVITSRARQHGPGHPPRRMLTLSSRTKPDTGHRAGTGMLTPNVADPPSHAQEEWRGTADQNAGYSALELGSRSRLGSHLVMKVGISRQRHSRLVAALTQGVCPICERNGSGEAPPGRSAALTASQTISVTRGDAD